MRGSRYALLALVALLPFGASACHAESNNVGSASTATTALAASARTPASASASPSPSASASAVHVVAVPVVPKPPREGGALVRSTTGDALYIADEDHSVLRRVTLPLGDNAVAAVALPGRPAQALAVGDSVLVTIRDPSLLLVLAKNGEGNLAEVARVVLPGDAWGIAVSPDNKTAVVTSAWAHQVSVVDLDTKAVRFSLDVEREPRGVVVRPDGKVAYVSHLIGAPLTRVDLEGVGKTSRVDLPAAPLRTPMDSVLDASFGFALALSADGKRLFASRHALGAPGDAAWFGAPSVDVLLLADEKPLAPKRAGKPLGGSALGDKIEDTWLDTKVPPLVQPRAMVYRTSARTLLVASEGLHTLVELDAVAIDPGVAILYEQPLGSSVDPTEPAPTRCSAPSGIALSIDEQQAFVWCRASGDLAVVDLRPADDPRLGVATINANHVSIRHLAADPLPAMAARGRREFYDATDQITSGGLACAGCHPEGRDDGHVWMEVMGPITHAPIFVGGPAIEKAGLARQTPMLAGRVASAGPYGWHAQNPDLEARILEGVHLHRWLNPPMSWENLATASKTRAEALILFLRNGLVPPPHPSRALTPQEERGRNLFSSQDTGCVGCHTPSTEYTARIAAPLTQFVQVAPFTADPNPAFKTPSLFFVGGTPPYFHDGHEPTLEAVIADNDDRMGRTNQLSEEDRAALVAFLKTL